MDQERIGAVEPVAGVRRVPLRRVVFEVDLREPRLRLGEELEPIDLVIGAGLEEDAIELEVAHLVGRHVVDAVGERERAPSAAISLTPPREDRQEEFDIRLRQVEEIVAVDMPGQYAEWSRHESNPLS